MPERWFDTSWTAQPNSWPEIPSEFTVTTLLEIEACPRRWALRTATYEFLWAGFGYPPRVHVSSIAGTVVHEVVQKVTRELAKYGCATIGDSRATEVMRSLGGYSALINRNIDLLLERHRQNPRALQGMTYTAERLRAQLPQLRTLAQTMMARVSLPACPRTGEQKLKTRPRRPLRFGVFSELEFRASTIGFKGRADLLSLTPNKCELIDFKTGQRNDKNVFQIRVYSLLWNRDEELNPERQMADRLVLCYSNGDVRVPPLTADELDQLECELVARRDAASQSVKVRPPEARPSRDNCQFCEVRQLCDSYWTMESQAIIAVGSHRGRYADVQLRIKGRHGPRSWDAIIENFHGSHAESPALLRTVDAVEFADGDRVRVIDAAVTPVDEEGVQTLVFSLSTLSEVFKIA